MFQLPVECRCVKGGAEIKYRVHTSLVHINTIRHTLTYGKSSNLAYARFYIIVHINGFRILFIKMFEVA